MGKSRKKPDDRAARSIGFPPVWAELAKRLAASERRPISWYVIGLLMQDAQSRGIEVPAAPWEKAVSE